MDKIKAICPCCGKEIELTIVKNGSGYIATSIFDKEVSHNELSEKFGIELGVIKEVKNE